jgi:GT2 family glycosyltransferase
MVQGVTRTEQESRTGTARLTLSVIVCAYTLDRWEDIRRAVASLHAQQLFPDEILLVTDHNEALHARAEAELSGVRVIANAEPRGLSGARNTGIREANGDVVAFLDDDAAAEPDWTVRLLAAYQDPAVMAVGGRIEPRWAAGRPTWFPPEFDWVVGCTYAGMPEEPAPVRNMIGANMSLRRSVLDELGGFSHGLGRIGARPLGCEETELCIRAGERHPDQVILYQPDAAVRHHIPADRGTWQYFRSRCWSEGISKAAVSRLAGPQRALSSEWRYVRGTVPRAFWRALTPRRTGVPLATAPALAAGVVITALGYVVGRLSPLQGQTRLPDEHPALPAAVRRWGLPLLLAAALTLWAISLPRVRVADLGGYGLVTRLPVTFWAGLALLVAGFALCLLRPGRSPAWMTAYTIALIAMERATQALVYPTLLYSWAWKHVAIIDRLSTNGGHLKLDGSLGAYAAYDQWAAFFSGNSALVRLLGVQDAMSYARWAPFVSSLLLLLPLLLIYQVFSRDRRLVWTAVWVFYLGNWVGQDYFSPQAFAFFLYLGVFAVVFRRLVRPAPAGRHAAADSVHPLTGVPRKPLDRRARTLWAALLVVPVLAVTAAHQLTPLMLGGGLVALLLSRRYRSWGLALVGIAAPVIWDATIARNFVGANLQQLIQAFGNLMSNASADTGYAPTGGGPVTIAWIDRGLSAGIGLLAVAGALRHPALRRTALPLILVSGVAIPMVVANNYGGEMIFRTFMFMLPCLAFFAAAAFQARPRAVPAPAAEAAESGAVPAPVPRPAWRATALTFPVLLALAAGFVFSYSGKDAVDYFPPGEVQLIHRLWAVAPTGSYIVAADGDFPSSELTYASDPHYWLAEDTPATVRRLLADPGSFLVNTFASTDAKAEYLVITQTQYNDTEMGGLLPPGGLAKIQRAADASPRFRVLFRNAYGTVYQYVPPASATQGGAR